MTRITLHLKVGPLELAHVVERSDSVRPVVETEVSRPGVAKAQPRFPRALVGGVR